MKGSITLHPEFGVNPSLDICFWCGEASGVALLGRNGGKEAPRKIISSMEPCTKCQEGMAQGITLMEASPKRLMENMPAIQEGIYATGRWIVVKEEAIPGMFNPEMEEALLKSRKGFVEVGVFDMLLPPDQQPEEKP